MQQVQQQDAVRRVIRVRWLLAFVLLAAIACDSPTVGAVEPSVTAGLGGTPVPILATLPALHLAGLHATATDLDLEAASGDAIDPGAFADLLTQLGFRGARERVYAGRAGVFARVVVRGWVFEDREGASSFLARLRERPRDLIGDAAPVRSPSLAPSVSLAVHEPSGCCHEETPIYLASWQRGPIVWTIRASGPRIHTPPVLSLISKVEQEV
jgi:hypothetical protein